MLLLAIIRVVGRTPVCATGLVFWRSGGPQPGAKPYPLSYPSEEFGRGEFIMLYPQNIQHACAYVGFPVVFHRLKIYIRVED